MKTFLEDVVKVLHAIVLGFVLIFVTLGLSGHSTVIPRGVFYAWFALSYVDGFLWAVLIYLRLKL